MNRYIVRTALFIMSGVVTILFYIFLTGCRNDPELSNVNVNLSSGEKVRSSRKIPFSGMLHSAINLNTKVFHGQGVSAAIVTDNNRYWTGTGGYSEPGVPVSADMLFNIGSIGKNFLAVLILQLAEEERLSLDDPVSKWGLRSPVIDKNITIRQLLNHTSGIFDWVEHRQSPFIMPYRKIDYQRIWTQEEILKRLAGDPYFQPGWGWNYSTTNYNLLKIIAEKTTRTTVSAEIMNRFIQPLGLEHTIVLDTGSTVPLRLEIVHGWFDVNGEGTPEDISGDSQNWIISMSPCMMYASATDLALWSQELYEGRVLNGASLKEMLSFRHPAPGEPPLTGYGLGTAEISLKGLIKFYGHLGYHYGNMSAMLYIPAMHTSLAVLTNSNNQIFQYVVCFDLLIAIVLIHLRYFIYAAIAVLILFISWGIFRRL